MKHACQRCGSSSWAWCDYRGCSTCFEAEPGPELVTLDVGVRMTGVCGNGKHDECRGRVYIGHVLEGGQRGAKFASCQCDCHDLQAAA